MFNLIQSKPTIILFSLKNTHWENYLSSEHYFSFFSFLLEIPPWHQSRNPKLFPTPQQNKVEIWKELHDLFACTEEWSQTQHFLDGFSFWKHESETINLRDSSPSPEVKNRHMTVQEDVWPWAWSAQLSALFRHKITHLHPNISWRGLLGSPEKLSINSFFCLQKEYIAIQWVNKKLYLKHLSTSNWPQVGAGIIQHKVSQV